MERQAGVSLAEDDLPLLVGHDAHERPQRLALRRLERLEERDHRPGYRSIASGFVGQGGPSPVDDDSTR